MSATDEIQRKTETENRKMKAKVLAEEPKHTQASEDEGHDEETVEAAEAERAEAEDAEAVKDTENDGDAAEEEPPEPEKQKLQQGTGSGIMSSEPFFLLPLSEPTMKSIKEMGFENMTQHQLQFVGSVNWRGGDTANPIG